MSAATRGRLASRVLSRVVGLLCIVALPILGATADVSIQTLIPFAENSEVRVAIREDCGLSARLSKAIVQRGAKKEIAIQRVGNLLEEGGSHSLELRITDAIKTGGGAFPTSSLSIDGALKREGKVIGTFIATRFAGASLLPFVRSECGILTEAVNLLAKDVVKWLKKPRLDSRLGDAR